MMREDDCISREAATSTICRWGVSLEKNGICSVTTHAMKQTLVNRIEKLPKVQPKAGWIPISERLPEESLNSVIGWDAYRERPVFVQYLDGHFCNMGSNESFDIRAWMPLPEPYKAESEAEE